MIQVYYTAEVFQEDDETLVKEGYVPYYGTLTDILDVRKYLRTAYEGELLPHQELGGFWTINLTENYELECCQCKRMYDIRGKENRIMANEGYCSDDCWDDWVSSIW